MYESYKTAFYQAIDEHKCEVLIPYKEMYNRGFEVPLNIDYEKKSYNFRMIILYDHGVAARKRQAILKKNNTTDFFQYNIINNPITVYKYMKRGKPTKNFEKIAEIKDNFSISTLFSQKAFDEALYRCGYYPLITNKPKEELTIETAMMAHKNQYKSERLNYRSKKTITTSSLSIFIHMSELRLFFSFLK